MRITGIQTRIAEHYEIEAMEPIPVNDLYQAAQRRLNLLQQWPDEVTAEWWRSQVLAHQFERDRYVSDTLAMLGSEAVVDGCLTWHRSSWCLTFGQQKWLRMIRKSLTSCTSKEIRNWLDQPSWPRTHYMGMTGVDSGAYTPPALGWHSDSAKTSMGHPVSLWLMWEGLHLLPSQHGRSGGWHPNRAQVRWPIWRTFCGYEWLRSAWWSEWLMADRLDERSIWIGDEAKEEPPPQYVMSRTEIRTRLKNNRFDKRAQVADRYWISPRQALQSVGVDEIFQARKFANPPPYAWRINEGRPI